MSEIASWLAGMGLAKYIEAFEKNELDFESARHLTDSDLKEIGLPLGPRRKILAAVANLNRSASPRRGSTSARIEAERRQLTVMFVDLVASTRAAHPGAHAAGGIRAAPCGGSASGGRLYVQARLNTEHCI